MTSLRPPTGRTGSPLASMWELLASLRAAVDTTPRIEPVDPPADVLAAFSAPPVVEYVPPSYSFTGVDISNENRVMGDLADLIADGMSPLAAAQAKFGAPHV